MRGAVITVLAGLLLWTYFATAADLLPPGLLLHFIAIPAVVGLLAYVSLHGAAGAFLWRIWLPFFAPVPAISAMGGDPAKPGLEWYLYGPMLGGVYLGEAIAWTGERLLVRIRKNGQAQA